MPFCWDLKDNPSVLVAFLHIDTTSIAWALGLRNLIIPGPFQHPMPIAGMPYDHARNAGCMAALEMGAEAIFFLDSDVIPPRDAILRLWRSGEPIISGLYCRRSPPQGVPVMMKPVGQWITQYKKGATIEVDVVGAGCLLIRREVLEKFKAQRPGAHWFDWRVDMKGCMPMEECLSEDFTFCTAAKKQGYRIMVDTSIRCRHAGYAEAAEESFKPLECHSVT